MILQNSPPSRQISKLIRFVFVIILKTSSEPTSGKKKNKKKTVQSGSNPGTMLECRMAPQQKERNHAHVDNRN